MMKIRFVLALPLVTAEFGQWCGSEKSPSLNPVHDTQFNANDQIEVIWAQAALFSANNGTQALGDLGLFHTALIFKQGDLAYTLEFDNAFTNDPTAPAGAGYYPTQRVAEDTGKVSLIWDKSAARWCMTKGILWGVDHWKKSYEVIGSMTRGLFFDLYNDLIEPTNSTNSVAAPLYNSWHVWKRTPYDEDVATDLTCGNGAVWVRDYLLSHGVKITGEQRVTRIEVNVDEVERVGPRDEEWSEVVDFYKSLQACFAGDGNIVDKMLALFNALPLHYTYEPSNHTHPYVKLKGLDAFLPEKIRFKKAPIMWGPIPGPNGPIPAPPPPPLPPLVTGPTYGTPDKYLRCQEGEKLFQVPIVDGQIARVCAPQCSGGPPDGTCPDAPKNAPGFWDKPNCNNPKSVIPGFDCVLRCGGVLPNLLCAPDAECFASSDFGDKGLLNLGVCMYRMDDDGTDDNVGFGTGTWLPGVVHPYVYHNDSLVV